MTALIPMYLKKVYQNEPIFQDSKVVYSAYEHSLDEAFHSNFVNKATINELSADDLSDFTDGDKIDLSKGAISFSDSVVIGSEELTDFVNENADGKVVLGYQQEEQLIDAYLGLYKNLLETKEESE